MVFTSGTALLERGQKAFESFALLGEGLEMKFERLGKLPLLLIGDESEKLCGIVKHWGFTIPVYWSAGGEGRSINEDSCILVFEYLAPYRHFKGVVLSDISRVKNIVGSSGLVEAAAELAGI